MPRLHWIKHHDGPACEALEKHLAHAGYHLETEPGATTVLIAADRPDPMLLPESGLEILWWVKAGHPEEVSAVLSLRPGWVVRQDSPLDAVVEAVEHLRHRDLGSEGWLRQMLHLATLDELLRLVLLRIVRMSGARQGAIWVRQDETFYQRCGAGFPEAPVSQSQASELVRKGEAHLLCASSQMGMLRLREPKVPERLYMGWLKEVEPLLLTAWNLEQSQALSFRDDLTVAQNRRCLEEELPRALRDAAARGEHLSLMFLDVDNLKTLNTAYGHPIGSRVLTTVAMEAQKIIRTQDRLYRYGGDEFCLMVRGTQALGASRMADRLIRSLMDHPLDISGQPVPISISIGIAEFPAHADGAESLVERADRALFAAKSRGKGCVVVAED